MHAWTLPRGGQVAMAGVSVGAIGAAAVGAITRFDPAVAGPVLCPFRLATGLPCPFCGLTRSLAALGHGQVGASFDLSPLGVLVLPLALMVLYAVLWSRRGRGAGWPARWPPWTVRAGLAVVAVSWVFQLTKGLT